MEGAERVMTKREVWENFQNNLRNIVNCFEDEKAQPEEVAAALRQLNSIVDSAMTTRYLSEIYEWEEIQCRIVRMRRHDLTRKEMLGELNNVLERLNSFISIEIKNEKINENLRKFFLECAEHVEEIAEIIEIENLLD